MNFEQKYYRIKAAIRVSEYLAEKHKHDTPIAFNMISPDVFRVDIKSLLSNKTVQRQLKASRRKT